MSPAPITRQRSPSRSPSASNARASSKLGIHATGRPAARVGRRGRDQTPVDAGEVGRPLAGRVDRQHDDPIGGRQRDAELPRERARARVKMRLEDGDHAPGAERPRGRDRRRDLGRVVGVVVVHRRAGRRRPEQLEPAPGAAEVRQRRRRPRRVGARQRAGGQRAGGVDRVVGAGDRQADLDPAPPKARAPSGPSSGSGAS